MPAPLSAPPAWQQACGATTLKTPPQTGVEAVAYFWLPLLVLVAVLIGLAGRPALILLAVGLLDVEAPLLGAGSPITLPFVVAVPPIGVAVAAPLMLSLGARWAWR